MVDSALDYKIDMFASLDFAHAYQTCQKCALAPSIITVAHDCDKEHLLEESSATLMTHHYAAVYVSFRNVYYLDDIKVNCILYSNCLFLGSHQPVSYTHLTLPTNR